MIEQTKNAPNHQRDAGADMPEFIRGYTEGLSYLRCKGEGSMTVVLLHGIGSNAHSFEPLMLALHPHYSSVAWDFPGYGQSEPLPIESPQLAHYAVVLSHLIEHLEIKRFVLVGHSLGCLVVARYARATPEGIAALFLISPALGYREKKGAPLPPEVAVRITELDRLGAAKFAAKRAPALLADPSARPDILQAVERAMAAVRRPGYDHAARVLAAGCLLHDAQHIEVPTAVIMGDKDYVMQPGSAHFAYAALQSSAPRYGFHLVRGGGHAVCQEKPQEIAQKIVEFVEAKVKANA